MTMQQHGGRADDGSAERPTGMMMGHRGDMMAGGMDHHRGRGPGHGGPGMLTMMMIMMDQDADRAVSLDEFQAVHARMFKYADADGDGKLTLEELRKFHGGDSGAQAD